MHLLWQDAYPPAIYERILEIRGVKQSAHVFFCTYVCAPTISTALKLFGSKNYQCMSLVYIKYQSRKNVPFPINVKIAQKLP